MNQNTIYFIILIIEIIVLILFYAYMLSSVLVLSEWRERMEKKGWKFG
jgi:hypothetical protein